jgi:hypothetical protein
MSGDEADAPVASVDDLLETLKASLEAREKIEHVRERLYGHVRRLIDGEALFSLEQVLWSVVDRAGVHDDESELTNALLAEALASIAYDPERNISTTPRGITDEEIVAAEYDETCELCHHDLEEAKQRRAGNTEDAVDSEILAMHAEAATHWREEHAVALARFGLAADQRVTEPQKARAS